MMIPKSQDAVTVRFEKRAANLIFGGLVGVVAAVDLDDQLSLNRAEIDEVGTDGMLAAELHVAHAFGSQMTPEDLLRGSLLATHSSSGFVRCFGRRHDCKNFAVPEKNTRNARNQNLKSRAKPLFPSPVGRGFKERDLAQRAIFFARDSRF
jgi:hypothetical protein